MQNIEEIQRLHERSVRGEIITAEEESVLQNWYEELDREEDAVLNSSQPPQDIEKLRRNLSEITDQTEIVSREVKNLISQNEKLRKENQALKRSLEEHLLEKVA